MRTSVQDATNVVKRLRELYRGPERESNVGAADANQVSQDAVSITQPRWRDQSLALGIGIVIETRFEEVPFVAIDPSDLREILINLILNAVDAMAQAGRITLRSSVEPQGVAIEVDDTGMGMSEEVLRSCLDPFFTTKGERGSGLGLSMAFGILQRSGGSIDIDSKEGSGTKFVLHLPLKATDRPEIEDTGFTEPLRPLHIRTVDDDDLGQQELTQLMYALGHTVDVASNGREGLEKFWIGAYDVVMTDRAMPDMNGDQLSAAIKDLDAGQRVIMMTGFGTIMEDTSEIPPGVDPIISKPITLAGLRDALLSLTA